MAQHTFPSIAQSEKEKSKKEYYEKWTKAIVCNTFNQSWSTSYNKLKMLYSFFQEGTGSNLTGYLQTAPDGSAMPGIWTSISNVKTRLKTLVGELEERGYVIKARALNSEAIDRKREERERLRAERALQDVVEFAESLTGLPLRQDEYIPQTDQELDEYMDLGWKDKHVIIIETALKWIAQRSDWDEKRKRLFFDVLIANMMIVKNEIIRGVPTPRVVDPMKFIFDPNSSDDTLSDSTYFGEVEYMPLAQAAERYGLTLKELEECYESYKTYLGLGMDLRGSSEFDTYFNAMPGQTVKWFTNEEGIPRTLVIKACWRDYKQLAHKYDKNEEYDKEFLQNMTGKDIRKKDEDKIIYNKIECWRQGTLVGGKFLKEWGECPNQARDLSTLEISECPYKVWTPEFFLGKSVSLVEQQMGLSFLKDAAAFTLQVQLARAIGKVLVIDEAYLPNGMTREQALSYIKADGVAWVNSKEYQNDVPGGSANLFKDFDMELSQTISQGISLIEYYDRQINQITGINSERQGQVAGASVGLGVQQTALAQSNFITAPYFKGMERFCSRVLNHQAKLVKVAWADKKVFAPIIGDAGVDFLREHIDISTDEFDVVVYSLPPQTMDRQVFMEWLGIAVQTGELSVGDAMMIALEPDMTVAVRKYSRKYSMRQAFMNRQQQQQFEAEQQMQQQQMMMQGQNQQAMLQNQLMLQQMKNQGNMAKTALTGRVKLNAQKMQLLSR